MARLLMILAGAVVLRMFSPALFAQSTPIDCIVVAQYSPDTSKEQHDKGIADNNDLMVSAKAFQAADKDSELKEINSSATLEKAFDAWKKAKKCCKKITLFSHGNTDGSLDLPYELPKADELRGEDRTAKGHTLGGPTTKMGWGRDRLDEFVKQVKKISCPEQTPQIAFDGCYTALEGGIAEQVAEKGIASSGFTGFCIFVQYDEEKHETLAVTPSPKQGTSSEKKSFEPKQPKKPEKSEKQPKKDD